MTDTFTPPGPLQTAVLFLIFNRPGTVDHLQTGYLAKPYGSTDCANGIQWVIAHEDSNQLALNARKKAEDFFSPRLVSSRYIEAQRIA